MKFKYTKHKHAQRGKCYVINLNKPNARVMQYVGWDTLAYTVESNKITKKLGWLPKIVGYMTGLANFELYECIPTGELVLRRKLHD